MVPASAYTSLMKCAPNLRPFGSDSTTKNRKR